VNALLSRNGKPVKAGIIRQPEGKKPGAYRYTPLCNRCGGKGGSEAWRYTGYKCYDCGGSGKAATREEPLYTPEQYAALEARREKLAAKRAAKLAAERAAADALADARRSSFLAEHQQLLDDALRADRALAKLFGKTRDVFLTNDEADAALGV